MSWLDDALARQGPKPRLTNGTTPPDVDRQIAEEVQLIDAVIQQLLSEYGERALGHTFRGKQFGTKLEQPGYKRGDKTMPATSWTWHWHLFSYVRNVVGLEVIPCFSDAGHLTAFTVIGGVWSETCQGDIDALKDTLVHAYLALHAST